jgi:hypothetical protein
MTSEKYYYRLIFEKFHTQLCLQTATEKIALQLTIIHGFLEETMPIKTGVKSIGFISFSSLPQT